LNQVQLIKFRNNGLPDGFKIVRHLNLWIFKFAQLPQVRSAALAIIGDVGNNNQEGQLERLTNFVRSRVRYVADPIGSEFVTSPVIQLEQIRRQGFTSGDCDDHVILLGSLAGSVGLESAAVGVKLPNSPIYNHVVNVIVTNGNEHLIDACRKINNPNVEGLFNEVVF